MAEKTATVSAAQRAAWDALWRKLLAPLPEEMADGDRAETPDTKRLTTSAKAS